MSRGLFSNCPVLLQSVWMPIRYGATLPVRIVLATSALLWAILLVVAPGNEALECSYVAMFSLASRWVWVTAFGANFLALAWRILARSPRVGVSRVVNALTCALWSTQICSVVVVQGYLPPDAADAVALLIAAVWTTLRTDLTAGDRETA